MAFLLPARCGKGRSPFPSWICRLSAPCPNPFEAAGKSTPCPYSNIGLLWKLRQSCIRKWRENRRRPWEMDAGKNMEGSSHAPFPARLWLSRLFRFHLYILNLLILFVCGYDTDVERELSKVLVRYLFGFNFWFISCSAANAAHASWISYPDKTLDNKK